MSNHTNVTRRSQQSIPLPHAVHVHVHVHTVHFILVHVFRVTLTRHTALLAGSALRFTVAAGVHVHLQGLAFLVGMRSSWSMLCMGMLWILILHARQQRVA